MTRAGEGQLSLFPPDPLLCWLWLAGTLGAGSQRAGAVLDAFGGAQEAWEARDTDAFAAAAGPAAVQRACLPDNTPEHYRRRHSIATTTFPRTPPPSSRS